MMPPMIGSLSTSRCRQIWPVGCLLRNSMMPMMTAKKPAVTNHRSVKKREKNSIIRVGSGSSAPSSSNSGLNCGST